MPGGVVVDPTTENTAEGDAKLDAALVDAGYPPTAPSPTDGATAPSPTSPTAPSPTSPTAPTDVVPASSPTDTGGEPTGEESATLQPYGTLPEMEAGTRTLPAFDCAGLTGYNCCLLIKLIVRDADIWGKAIQCQLIYTEGSNKEKFWLNSRGKKIFIFANHDEFVTKIPTIVGNWPKGQGPGDFSGWLEDGGDPNRTDWIPEENYGCTVGAGTVGQGEICAIDQDCASCICKQNNRCD